MAIPRKKITTNTTTVVEEFQVDHSESLNSTDTIINTDAHEFEKTGGSVLSEAPATTTNTDCDFSNKTGKTWGDIIYIIFVTNTKWFNLLVVLCVYVLSFYFTMNNFHDCSLLSFESWEWLFTPVKIGTIIVLIYFLIKYFIFYKK